jgi:hypothetical protein
MADAHWQDRRRDERVPTSGVGRIWYGRNLNLWAECRLRNLSARGAKIEIPAVYELPRRIVLAHQHDSALFDAVIKWRTGDVAGLSLEKRHPLETCTDARLAPIAEMWRSLRL